VSTSRGIDPENEDSSERLRLELRLGSWKRGEVKELEARVQMAAIVQNNFDWRRGGSGW
jgi:hypothetical protein